MYNMSMNDRQISQLEIVKTKVRQLLGGDTSGHADDHVERVALLAERFANGCSESVNLQEVLLTAWLHDLDKQLPVCGKDCVFKIVAVDFVPTDALHAAMFLAVVQQKTIAVYIVAAKLFDEGVDPL